MFLSGHWIMVVGGYTGFGNVDTVDLISLDPVNHPVSECLKDRNPFYTTLYAGAGATLNEGIKKSFKLFYYFL